MVVRSYEMFKKIFKLKSANDHRTKRVPLETPNLKEFIGQTAQNFSKLKEDYFNFQNYYKQQHRLSVKIIFALWQEI